MCKISYELPNIEGQRVNGYSSIRSLVLPGVNEQAEGLTRGTV